MECLWSKEDFTELLESITPHMTQKGCSQSQPLYKKIPILSIPHHFPFHLFYYFFCFSTGVLCCPVKLVNT